MQHTTEIILAITDTRQQVVYAIATKQHTLNALLVGHHIGAHNGTLIKHNRGKHTIVIHIGILPQRYQHQRRVMAVSIRQAIHISHTGCLRLQIHTHLIGRLKSSIGRAVTTKTHMV